MIGFLYLCNGEKRKDKHLNCGECKHTHDPVYAKNRSTVKLVNEFLETFDPSDDSMDRFWEKEETDE